MAIQYPRLPAFLAFALAASALSLALALTSEYVFGLKPCELCIFQRVPYAAVIPVALLGLWKPRLRYATCVVIGLCFLVDSGIATYHAAVEQHWIPGPEACTDSTPGGSMTVEQILAKIKNAPIVACDQPQWDFHGITMAAMNAMWAFMLAAATFIALHKNYRRPELHA